MSAGGQPAASSAGPGLGISGALTVLFVGLRLTDHIAWSWWWVLSPLWISAALFLVVAIIALFAMFVMLWVEQRSKRTLGGRR